MAPGSGEGDDDSDIGLEDVLLKVLKTTDVYWFTLIFVSCSVILGLLLFICTPDFWLTHNEKYQLNTTCMQDEEAKAGREGRPGAVRVKAKPATKNNNKGGIAIGDVNDGLEGMESPQAVTKKKEAAMAVAAKSSKGECSGGGG